MKMKIYILIGLILSILVSGCIQQAPKGAPPEIGITIDIPKTSLAVGEKFEGEYIAENKGGPFSSYTLVSCKKEGYDKKCVVRSYYWISVNLAGGLKACEITERGYTCCLESFRSPGTYNYEVAVYDCAKIEEILGVSCNDADEDDVVTQVSPLNATKKVTTHPLRIYCG